MKRMGILSMAVALLLASALPLRSQGPAPQGVQKISLSTTSEPIADIFKLIEGQSSFVFAWGDDVQPKLSERKTISVNDTPVVQVLQLLLKDTGLTFNVKGQQIVISLAPVPQSAAAKKPRTVTGTVISSVDNQPIIGATVFIDGSTTGAATTDLDGNYTINVPASAKDIVFSCLGYEERKIPAGEDILLKVVTMSEQTNILEDAVVVGFGKQKKESMVGSVVAINPGELKTTSSNLSNAFAGRIAGVLTVQSSGEPGADGSNFWIRGISTFGSNTKPLIILDGVEIDSDILNMIAPETIEQFSVLKDATSTALYGSKGANGVMIITTKDGKNNEKMSINIRVENGWTMPSRLTKVADGITYMENFNEARANDNLPQFYSDEQILGTKLGLNPYVYPNNDWYSMMFKNFAMNQTANLTVRGGSKKIDYFLNACFNREDGILRKSSISNFNTSETMYKYQFQSNVGAQITPTTKISMKMTAQMTDINKPYDSANTLFLYVMQSNPVQFPAYFPAEEGDTHVRYGSAASWGTGDLLTNPLAFMNRGSVTRATSMLLTTFSIDQDFSFVTKGLRASFMASWRNNQYNSIYNKQNPYYQRVANTWVNPDGSIGFDTTDIGTTGSEYMTSTSYYDGDRRYNLQATIDYARKFGRHDISATLVYLQSQTVTTEVLPYRTQGFAGRATYNYDSRYFIEGNFGYNGSENFAPGKRWGFFPSVAGGWVISNEHFFGSDLKRTLSLLKLRFSYGLSGNDSLPSRFPYIGSVTMNASRGCYFGKDEIALYQGGTINSWGNTDATWEVSRKLNIGLEIGLWNDFSLIVDAFREYRTGIFMKRNSISANSGFSNQTPYANIGEVENKGIDATMEYKKVFNKDFTLSVHGTFTYAHNEIMAKDEPTYQYSYQKLVGKPINSIYGYVSAGLFQSQEEIDSWPKQDFGETLQPGDIKYVDLNGDGVVDGDDQTCIGYPTVPEISYGLGCSLNWKKLDFSILFQGAGNVSILMSNHYAFLTKSVSGLNMAQWVADDHWTETNRDAAYPRLSSLWNQNNNIQSSFWVKNGAYLRLKNIEMGYTIGKFRIFTTASNLFTISPFKYWDPEMGSGNGLSYPIQTVVRLGVQFNFN